MNGGRINDQFHIGSDIGSALADLLAVLLEQAVCRVPGLMRPSGKNCT